MRAEEAEQKPLWSGAVAFVEKIRRPADSVHLDSAGFCKPDSFPFSCVRTAPGIKGLDSKNART
jgi:hypothetical protein